MPILPVKIRLDIATVCQLKCPTCPTASGEISRTIGSGFLKFDNFKKFIDDNPHIRKIEISNWGEVFLNRDIIKIMEYSYLKNISLHCDNGANFNKVSNEVLEALVKYRFRSITCSIDGASAQTYAIYRRNGNFDDVLKNIRALNQIKKNYHSKWPQLKWQLVVFGHNIHEIPLARKMAEDLGMRFWVKLSWGAMYTGSAFSPVQDSKVVRQEAGVGAADRTEYQEKYGESYAQRFFCSQMWVEPQVNFDGKILGCCINYWGDYGNAFNLKTSDWFNNEKMNYARQMLMGKKEAKEGVPCSSCVYYHSMKENKNWLRPYEINISRLVYRFRHQLQDDKYRFLLLAYFTVKGFFRRVSRRFWS